ncbi:MAG: Sec-independent protein translocase protein TatB [Actinomycetota bacterium]|nr:Sec-independent protein translocase protein TatB [Actinomycetota bacterium]
MGSIGPAEILVVLVVALLVLGPNRLPDAARSVGRAIGELRRYTSGFQEEIREAFSEPVEPTPSYPPSPRGAPAGASGTEAVAPPQDGGDGASRPS